MTPWDQGPDGAGQEAIYEGIPNAEKHVIRGSNHSTIFDNTEEHNRVVIEFFQRAQPGRSDQLVPAVEEYGVEPIPAELRTTRWRDLFAINFTFFLNPVMYVLGAIAVVGVRAAASVGDRRDGARAGARVRGDGPDRRGRASTTASPARWPRGRRSASGARACSARRTA